MVLSVTMEIVRSNKLLRYRAASIPRITAIGTATTAAEAAKKIVEKIEFVDPVAFYHMIYIEDPEGGFGEDSGMGG